MGRINERLAPLQYNIDYLGPTHPVGLAESRSHISMDASPDNMDGLQPMLEPFGTWLLSQRDRGDWIDGIAKAAREDRYFPKRGTPDEVRAHFTKLGADGDAFEALNDAELDWASL